ncbi:hypothetical protein OH77DRAFT_1522281 [Trametes cingulata]|nr:hypothetical protein OH77DRAFT_1522281 [Trametes cingulata]
MAATNSTMYPTVGNGPSTPLFPALPSLDNTVGAVLIGTFVSLTLYGLILHQAYRYFRMYHEDTILIRAFVISVLIVETIHTVFCTHIVYYYLVTNYFKPQTLMNVVWSMSAQPVLSSIGISISQCFFAYRVYMISPKFRLLVAVAVLCEVISLGFTSTATYEGARNVTYVGFLAYAWLDSAALGCSVVSDILTTSVLISTLRKSRTGIKRTDHMIDSLILYTVNTGLLTSITNILALVLAVAMPDNIIYVGVAIIITKVYANSLLAVLNTRRSLAATDVVTSGPLGLSGIANATTPRISRVAPEVWNVRVPERTASDYTLERALDGEVEMRFKTSDQDAV